MWRPPRSGCTRPRARPTRAWGATTLLSTSTGRCSPSPRAGPGSTIGSGACSWRGRAHPCRRPTPRRNAAREFEEELRVDPSNADAAYELGEIRRKAGDLDRARELFQAAVEHYPDFEQGLVGLGRVLVSQGKADLALPPLTRAVSLNPEDDVAYFQLWQAHRSLGHREEQEKAQAEFQRLRGRKRERERLNLIRQHVVTQQELDAQMTPP